MLRWTRRRLRQIARRIHERDVRKRLREITDQPSSRIVLLGEQPHIIAEVQQPLEQPACFVVAADQLV
jgi:UDP-N-acetyl-D-mannosaminuronic acid transferase (WecB/TagA/CpsF family)